MFVQSSLDGADDRLGAFESDDSDTVVDGEAGVLFGGDGEHFFHSGSCIESDFPGFLGGDRDDDGGDFSDELFFADVG